MGDLRIFETPSKKSEWGQNSIVVLTGARAASLDNSDDLKSWPTHLSSLGFEFQRLVGVEESGADRAIQWWHEWGDRDEYVYAGAAKLAPARLRSAGATKAADDLLFEYRVADRHKACASNEWLVCIWLSVSQYTIGYGIGGMKFLVVIYLAVLPVIGAIVILVTKSTTSIVTAARLSLVTAMPFLEIDKKRMESVLDSVPDGVLIYLHVQKLLGWALALILVAALAGLTQHN